ncbi:MAG TPA: response regulator [Opitutaceae bacterium]|jgi:DNA-binding NarL/FixJ family response regulator
MPRPTSALIIDDEPHVRLLLAGVLKQLGVKSVWEAVDGAAGLAMVSAHKPGVVLLDINLPGPSGLQILEKVKAEQPGLPVVVISAQSTMRTMNRARDLGAHAFIVKYATKTEVTQALSDALSKIGGDGAAEPAAEAPKAG